MGIDIQVMKTKSNPDKADLHAGEMIIDATQNTVHWHAATEEEEEERNLESHYFTLQNNADPPIFQSMESMQTYRSSWKDETPMVVAFD